MTNDECRAKSNGRCLAVRRGDPAIANGPKTSDPCIGRGCGGVEARLTPGNLAKFGRALAKSPGFTGAKGTRKELRNLIKKKAPATDGAEKRRGERQALFGLAVVEG